jgi:H+/gluconate symporter-like permease
MKNNNQILDDALSSAERVQFEKMEAHRQGLFTFYTKMIGGAAFVLAIALIVAYFELGFESRADAAAFMEKIGNAASGFVFACLCCVINHLVFALKFYD